MRREISAEAPRGGSVRRFATSTSSGWVLAMAISVIGLMAVLLAASPAPLGQYDARVLAGFGINSLLGVTMMIRAALRTPYSLEGVHWIFFVIFFVSTPLQQYLSRAWPWDLGAGDKEVLSANVLVTIWGAAYCATSLGTPLTAGSPVRGPFHFELSPVLRSALAGASVLSTILFASKVGASGLLYRTEVSVDLSTQPFTLLFPVVCRAVVVFSFTVCVMDALWLRQLDVQTVIAGACVLIVCFPTALARFNVAAIYLGLGVVVISAFRNNRGLFGTLLILGFLVAYPALNAFKYVGSGVTGADVADVVRHSLTAGYTSGNYDAYSMLMWTRSYVANVGTTGGEQLLGALFFFVPRSLWPTKPIPSGQLVFQYYGRSFSDVSSPLPAEGYINFGVPGVILFALAYGLLCRKLDGTYWVPDDDANEPQWSRILLETYYPFFLCLSFYMMRGALMTTLTVVVGDLVVFALGAWAVWSFTAGRVAEFRSSYPTTGSCSPAVRPKWRRHRVLQWPR